MQTDSYSQVAFHAGDFAIFMDVSKNSRFGVPIQVVAFFTEHSDITVHFQQLGQYGQEVLSDHLKLEYFQSDAATLPDFYADYLHAVKERADTGDLDTILHAATLFYIWAFRGTEKCIDAMAQAVNYYQQASDLGNAQASYELSQMYLKIINPDYDACFKLNREVNFQYYLIKSAEQGHAVAQYQYAYYLQYAEKGFQQDDEKAVYWYQQSANQDYPQALNNLGDKYERGKVVKLDYAQAVAYYQRSANHNIVEAIYNLGRLYLRGLGVAKDEVKGRALLTQAADRYYRPAQRKLKSLDKQ